jgi:quinoprotein glucose dehydrogenase
MNKTQLTILVASITASSSSIAQQGMRNGEWHYWGGDAGSTRYSSLEQIDATNAKKLAVAWRWQALPVQNGPASTPQMAPTSGRYSFAIVP